MSELEKRAKALAKDIFDEDIEDKLQEWGSDLAHDWDPLLGTLTEAIMGLERMTPWPEDQSAALHKVHADLMDTAMQREDIGGFLIGQELVNKIAGLYGDGVRGLPGAPTDTKETDDNDNHT